MKRFQLFFKNTSERIENYPLALPKYIALFIALLSIRLCLEFFANHRLFNADDVLHIGLWFIFIILAFVLQLQYFSKTSIDKIIKLVVCCFSIALSAPIIDLIVSQGKFSKMNYLSINSTSDFIKAYFSIGGASLSRGATIGIRIEIILLVLASFNYIYIRTNNLIRAILGTTSVYTVLFLTGVIPLFIGQLNAFFGLTYGQNDQSSIYLLFTLDLFLVMILLLKLKPDVIKTHLNWSFIIQFFSIGIPLLIGSFLARFYYPLNWTLNPTTLYFIPLLIILTFLLAIYTENIHKMMIHRKRQRYQNSLIVLLFSISALLSFQTLFALFLVWSINFVLYEKPCEFYKYKRFSSILKSFLTLAIIMLGFISFGAPMVGFNKLHIFFILIFSFSISLGYSKLKHYFSRLNLH
jgi:hypothetical protein